MPVPNAMFGGFRFMVFFISDFSFAENLLFL